MIADKLKKAGLVILAILLSVFIAEGVLRLVYKAQQHYYVWQPNLKHVFIPDSSVFNGVKGASVFTINADGYRGKPFQAGELNYLAIGGSTTECLYLDDKETWQALMGNGNVGSIGKSGCTTRENYIQLKYYVPQVANIKGVVMMVGLNDMVKRLSQDTLFNTGFKFTPQVEDSFVNTIFLKGGRATGKTWWRRTAVFYVLQQALQRTTRVEWQSIQDDRGAIYKTWRNKRQQATQIIDTLPDLTAALEEYGKNLQLIYNQTRLQKIKLVLVNQAALYKDTMSAYEQNLLWMGGKGDFQGKGPNAYYSPAALNKALQLYNTRLKQFCAGKADVVFIDLSAQLPRDTSVFYDDCHFNERGAQQVARIISAGLGSQE